ncbi:MAG: hypothetical protein J5819_03700 [Eubacterium sp.]|nr:hypothetical protein [Eubacterium sp.]
MRKSMKALALVMICALLFGAIGVRSNDSQASGTYWVTGSYGSSKVVFNGKKFKFSGKWGKGSSLDRSATAFFDGDTINFKKSIKKGKNLRTGTLSDDMYYDDVPNVTTGTNLVGITLHVKIKNNRVVEVIGSAM